MKAVIMAGGHGTRIRSVASDIPKPMIPVLGKPVLEYQIEELRSCGITDITLVTGYLAEAIHSYFGDGERLGVRISYFQEDVPMGTAGALHYLAGELKEDFLLLMGDLMLSVDFKRMEEFHRRCKAAVTLFVHPNSHPYDSDIIVTDSVGRPEEYCEEFCGAGKGIRPAEDTSRCRVTGVIGKKQERPQEYHNQVNAGIYMISPEVAASVPEPLEKVDLDKDVIRPLIGQGLVYAYRSTEYVRDMGTPERYEEVTKAMETGLVGRRNLREPQKCIFMDRDGTINVERGFLADPDGMELLPGAAEAIRKINRSSYLAVVITNQPVLARGECSFAELDRINQRLETLLGAEGAYIDGLLYCPHHTDKGFEGEVPELKFVCGCRKPAPGLILEAAQRYHIDPASSWMVGDSTSDVGCGANAGTRTVLVSTGRGGSDARCDLEPDLRCPDLAAAVDAILERT